MICATPSASAVGGAYEFFPPSPNFRPSGLQSGRSIAGSSSNTGWHNFPDFWQEPKTRGEIVRPAGWAAPRASPRSRYIRRHLGRLEAMKRNPHRIEFTVADGFKSRVKLLAAKWGVKSNVAIQRSVELSLSRERSDEEKQLLKAIAARLDQIAELLLAS
jgi:hypothetical protein